MPLALIATLAIYVMCWQGYKLRERLNGVGQFGILLGLVCTLANSTTARLSEAYPHTPITGQYIRLLENVLITGGCVGYYLLRLGVEGKSTRDRSFQRTIGGAALLTGILAALTGGAIATGQMLGATEDSYRTPLGFLIPFLSCGYCGTLLLMLAVWMWRYVADRARATRVGMRLAATGLMAMATLSFGMAVGPAIVFFGGSAHVIPFVAVRAVTATAFPLAFIGLSYPLLASRWVAFRRWAGRRSVCARAQVTVQTLRIAYPEIELPPESMWDRVKHLVSNHYTQARIVVESFDGLAKLLIHDAAATGPNAQAAAARLRAAVQRYDAAHTDEPVVDVISPTVAAEVMAQEGGPQPAPETLDREINFLVALADELRAEPDTDELAVA